MSVQNIKYKKFGPTINHSLLVAVFILFWGLVGASRVDAKILSTVPSDGARGVPLSSVINIKFDSAPVTVDKNAINLYDEKGISYVFKTYTSGDTLTIVPFVNHTGENSKYLDSNTNYSVFLGKNAVKNSMGNLLLASPEVITFTTAYSLDYLIMHPSAFDALINTKAPRGITVVIPKKYINKVDISYLTNVGGAVISPLTNVDVNADEDVHRMTVQFGGSEPIEALIMGSLFNAGYQGLLTYPWTDTKTGKTSNVGLDLSFVAYDKYDRPLETKVIKLDAKGKQSVQFKDLHGEKTLYDLIANGGKTFTDILTQYQTTDLLVY